MIDISDLRNAVSDRKYLNELKNSGAEIIGYFCTYAPEEIILAAGLHPARLFETGNDSSRYGSFIQSYSCSIVRNAIEEASSGSFDFLHGAVFPHSCDTLQRLSDIWRMNTDFPFFSDILLPVKIESEISKKYLADIFKKFKFDIEKHTGTEISNSGISDAVKTTNRIRILLNEISILYSENPDIFEPDSMNVIIRSSMMMERNFIIKRLSEIIRQAEESEVAATDKKRLILSGGFCSGTDIYKILSDIGAYSVWEDSCSGGRYYSDLIIEDIDPIEALAEKYFRKSLCPSKFKSINSRSDDLINAFNTHNADGIVFLFNKFCDPHFFDYPYLKKNLDNNNINSILIEIDGINASEQIKNRIQTFIEMI